MSIRRPSLGGALVMTLRTLALSLVANLMPTRCVPAYSISTTHLATASTEVAVLLWLVEEDPNADANLRVKDNLGQMPRGGPGALKLVSSCVKSNDAEALYLLLGKGIPVHQRLVNNDGPARKTLVDVACQNGVYISTFEKLLEFADFRRLDDLDNTSHCVMLLGYEFGDWGLADAIGQILVRATLTRKCPDWIRCPTARRMVRSVVRSKPPSRGRARCRGCGDLLEETEMALPGLVPHQLNALARTVQDLAPFLGIAYNKNEADLEYIPQSKKNSLEPSPGPEASRQQARGVATAEPRKETIAPKPKPLQVLNAKASSAPTKISISGSMPMKGASTALLDLKSAICSLELSTKPRATGDPASFRCDCVSELWDECSREKQVVHCSQHKKLDISKAPMPFVFACDAFHGKTLSEAEAEARKHRDQLLWYQSQNAWRTRSGTRWRTLMWRGRWKVPREMEWEAKPEWEKRRAVVSIDLVGGRVVKKMVAVERPATLDEEEPGVADVGGLEEGVLAKGDGNKREGGTFSQNPLLGALIRLVYSDKGKGKGKGRERESGKGPKWRRVQDDMDDMDNNSGVVLDGGVHGHADEDKAVADEPARG
ncbi:uncharacterized protein DNG_05148 [Cephalotrichum gorgonifer]|uniref:Uncharacterized protein n=1 Tax=Cephalotrichum gorgonifer TaxID=2041049 RepID=A0AAE8SV82_9PEZI|nr:uncharacterized protein DNG_05148 [Cephalotrichum gorgonifer]